MTQSCNDGHPHSNPVKRLGCVSSSDRVADIAGAVILLYAVFSSLQFALQDEVRHLLTRIVDDASYYMTIARNVAAGRGLTFDGIHPTNGFHPLWLVTLVPLVPLRGTPETMIRLVGLLQTALLSLAYLVFLRTQARLFSAPAAAALLSRQQSPDGRKRRSPSVQQELR